MKTTFSPFIGEMPISRTHFHDRSLTKQANKKECDINNIIAKFNKTGQLTHVRSSEGQYADFDTLDYHTAMNVITDAQGMFNDLPSNVRADFSNDPGQFVEFALNPDNNQAMQDYGLAPINQTPISPEIEPQTTPEKPAPIAE